jgi:hypothetical protein
MKRQFLFLCSVAVIFSATFVSAADREFQALYNGKDLSGWDVKDGKLESWQADGALLSCVKPGGGWLRTKRTYSDFVLRLEYRIPAGGNSGVGLRFPATGNPAHVGMEIQVLDDDAPKYAKLNAAQYTGGIYYQAPAKRGAIKPAGEWNSYEISCIGPQVKIVLNDKVINDVDLDKYTKGEDGKTALADRPRLGYVGLQSHGSRVDFHNIAIKNLATTMKSGLQYTDLTVGKGDPVPAGATVTVHYTGRLVEGKKFDSSRDREQPATFSLERVIRGWQEGIPGMRVGGRRKLIIPPELAYGERGARGVIPPNATLVFDVQVLAIK